MTVALMDASYLIALGHKRDSMNLQARRFIAQNNVDLLLSDVVLVEALYNLRRLGGNDATIKFASSLAKRTSELLPLTPLDFQRATELMNIYAKARLDFVDCCLTALAERLDITKICTFDRRDFSMIRPKHTEYFELLP